MKKNTTVKIVRFRDWVFEVDYDRTKEIYSRIEWSSLERCNCNNCRNFVTNRKNVYPNEIIAFFSQIGVDHNKESEIYHMLRLEDGLHHYGGWFHFKGKLLSGEDAKIKVRKNGWTYKLEDITENFSIGFSKDYTLHNFDDCEKNELVQIDFIVDIEWVIDKALESE